jgi:hypothetical protein
VSLPSTEHRLLRHPWINVVYSAAQARGDTDGSLASAKRNGDNQVRQQKAAVKIWENEGGRLGIPQSMRR